jgi:outer membrane protein W
MHELNWPAQKVLDAQVPYMRRTISENYGYGITFAMMLMARYGFLPDKEVPFGRLQPYLGAGPGAFLSRIDIFPDKPGHSESQEICLNVETGIRYLIQKNISVNLSLKYRYVVPPYHLDENYMWVPGQRSNEFLTIKPNYHMFNIIAGVAYHF